MKIQIMEYGFDKNTNTIFPRAMGKANTKYDKSIDSYYAEYKNNKVPVKHDYIINNVLSVVNYENSFIPIKTIEFKIVNIDSIGKAKLTLQKANIVAEKGFLCFKKKRESNITDDDLKLRDSIKKADELIDPEEIKEDNKAEDAELNNIVLKMCSIPMAIRSYYLLQLKRLHEKSLSWWGRNINVVMVVMFFVMTIAVVYICWDFGSRFALEGMEKAGGMISKFQIFAVRNETSGYVPVSAVETTTATTVPKSGFLNIFPT